MRSHTLLAGALMICLALGCATKRHAPPIDPNKIVDLSHSFGPNTIHWPTAEPFKLQRVTYGRRPEGYFYAANNISMAEHCGTHMDAPIHFAEGRITADQVPLKNCIGRAVVIDVRTAAAKDPDYRLTADDISAFERRHGRIPGGAIVIMNSGWSGRWPDKRRYLGTDKPMDVANLHFPGFSQEAAEFLVNQRAVAALAVDTASIDYGQSKDFIVHQVLHTKNKPAFENVANVNKLPPTGATFVALPLKIEQGSGSPARIVAILP